MSYYALENPYVDRKDHWIRVIRLPPRHQQVRPFSLDHLRMEKVQADLAPMGLQVVIITPGILGLFLNRASFLFHRKMGDSREENSETFSHSGVKSYLLD